MDKLEKRKLYIKNAASNKKPAKKDTPKKETPKKSKLE